MAETRIRYQWQTVTLSSVTPRSSVMEKVNEINKHDANDTYDACLGAS
jgi:hypothetical protein